MCVFFIEPHLQQIGVILRGTGGMGPQFLKSGRTDPSLFDVASWHGSFFDS